MSKHNENDVLDWDKLSPEDQARAEYLMKELNNLFNKYLKKEDKPCEDSTLDE